MGSTNSSNQNNLQKLREHLLSSRNFDATELDPDKFAKITANRMSANGSASLSEYIDLLEVRPAEYGALFTELFSSDGETFDARRQELQLDQVLSPILASSEPIRIWVINCGRGINAYMVAIVACESLGLTVYQRRVKLFATESDESALAIARQGTYSAKDLAGLPSELLDKYFVPSDGGYTFRSDLRRLLTFGHHDVLEDPPISKMDLILAPHVLPFFDDEKQQKALSRVKFALREGRYLLVGRGSVLKSESGFQAIDRANGLFAKSKTRNGSAATIDRTGAESEHDVPINDAAFDKAPVSIVVVDAQGNLAMATGRARTTFGILIADFGRPLQDLEISYRPVELRSLIEQTHADGRPVILKSVARPALSGKTEFFHIYVRRLYDTAGVLLGTSIQYLDTTEYQNLKTDLLAVNNALETANEELQSAREELETTNEELQSTNEELETTNEELQSTNEELQTMNEELQSANTELVGTNVTQRSLTLQIDQTNSYLEGILGSMHSMVVVLSTKFDVLVWNRRGTDLFGLHADEVVGRSFFSLDTGLPVEKLKAPLNDFVKTNQPSESITLPAVNRKGKPVNCNIRMVHLEQGGGGILLILDTDNNGNGITGGSNG